MAFVATKMTNSMQIKGGFDMFLLPNKKKKIYYMAQLNVICAFVFQK